MDRRQILLALTALAAAPGAALAAPSIEAEGARRIGEAYLAAHPQARDPSRLKAELLPDGWSPAALNRLRARVTADFRRGRMFTHRGWRISDTEGRLFALAALTA